MGNDRFKLTEEIISTADEGMKKLIGRNIKLNFDEIASFEFPLDEAFGLQVCYKNAIYCFVIRFSSKNKNLICAGPGAHPRDTIRNNELLKPPFFDRWSWYKHFKESFIAYADPMLFYDDDLKIAWFIGNRREWYLEDLSAVIEELAKNQGIINDNILFYGSSGGGFTSVVLATLIRNSHVLINNSQLFLLNYWKDILDPLFDILCESFEGMDKNDIIKKIKYRLDVIELFKKENYAPFITYYVNAASEWDIKCHTMPFLNEIYKLKQFSGLDVIYYREIKEVPHQPMASDKSIRAIKDYCKNYLYNTCEDISESSNQNIYIEGKYVAKLEKRNRKLKKQNKKLKKQYDEMTNSKSWKLTSPLRKLK